MTASAAPPLPPGQRVELAGRGTTFVREVEGPPGAPTVVLLHGWTVTADLNWYPSYQELGRHFSVLALDHRGHGQGVRSSWLFRLEDCADDAVALLRALGRERGVLVGYSMGGPVAQLAWRRHPDAVQGLVLCATAATFSSRQPAERLYYASLLGLSAVARVTPGPVRQPLATAFIRRRLDGTRFSEWATTQLASGDTAAVLQAGSAIGSFDSRPWLGTVDVPTAVVVTTGDQVVSPWRQEALAGAIPGATVHRVAGGHGVCVDDPDRFLPALVEACLTVARPA
ncbi:MAG: alpha/beta fold hydrolase [Acidimicrobiales bacterium]